MSERHRQRHTDGARMERLGLLRREFTHRMVAGFVGCFVGPQIVNGIQLPQRDGVDAALERAVNFLLSQQKESGAISDSRYETSMSAIAIMALASVGHQPCDDTAMGDAMYRAIEFVLSEKRQEANGYFGQADGSRMYGHGIITLMLTEMLGMGRDEQQDQRISDALEKALTLILKAQQVRKAAVYQGGWRYEPNSTDSDLSVSVWQLMALRSAKNDGLDIPIAAIESATAYLERSYSRPDRDDPAGGFAYIPNQNNPTFAMAAAGLLAMQVCGHYEAPEVIGASDWLLKRPLKLDERFFFYGCYYYAQGMHQRGGTYADTAAEQVISLLLPRQRGDGAWESNDGQEKDAGLVYSTGLAMLSLSVKYHFLPIYQR
jgi:hypothetical protein